jgi:hypothetical protein
VPLSEACFPKSRLTSGFLLFIPTPGAFSPFFLAGFYPHPLPGNRFCPEFKYLKINYLFICFYFFCLKKQPFLALPFTLFFPMQPREASFTLYRSF